MPDVSTMKAAVIHNYGVVDDVVEVVDVPTPVLGPHDVLIEARAAGVNPVDYLIVNGFQQRPLPRALGNEVAGVVRAVGPAVAGFTVGDEVFARVDPELGGAFAEQVAVGASLVAVKPPELSFEEAASLPLVALTALQALTEQAEVRPGQRVLIHGGAGGVGSAATQIAKSLGATVVTTATGDGVELARSLGADQVIDYRAEDFVAVTGKVDVVLDTVGGDARDRSFAVLKAGGTLVSIVGAPEVPADQAGRGVQARGFFMRPSGDQLTVIADLVTSGRLTALVRSTFPLGRVVDALNQVERGGARGKTVIRIAG
ncbi:NADP-dependent oxidoreductase [Amycolatopsis sp. cmx-4-61]|uniref:NADP-dependent oxidoreductase n=1 Tax=Amycolatopsis sp. cmx-4-61 TaxID=2790937 RepID=UPI0039793365